MEAIYIMNLHAFSLSETCTTFYPTETMICACDSTCARFLFDMLGSTERNRLNQRFSLTTNFTINN